MKDSDLVLMQLVYDIIWWKLGLQSIKLGDCSWGEDRGPEGEATVYIYKDTAASVPDQ